MKTFYVFVIYSSLPENYYTGYTVTLDKSLG